jgi:hypothetical protein
MDWNHPATISFVSVTGTFTLGFLGKVLWEHYFKEGKRIMREEDCLRNQVQCQKEVLQAKLTCQKEVLATLKGQARELEDGEAHFDRVDSALMIMLLTLLKICSAMKVECEDLSKMMIEKGLLK